MEKLGMNNETKHGCGKDIGGIYCGDFIGKEIYNDLGHELGKFYYCEDCQKKNQSQQTVDKSEQGRADKDGSSPLPVSDLKTLKEIYKEGLEDDCGEFIDINRLKAEVMKWIKEIRNVGEEGLAIEKSDKILMRIFNLTEEELKNGDKK